MSNGRCKNHLHIVLRLTHFLPFISTRYFCVCALVRLHAPLPILCDPPDSVCPSRLRRLPILCASPNSARLCAAANFLVYARLCGLRAPFLLPHVSLAVVLILRPSNVSFPLPTALPFVRCRRVIKGCETRRRADVVRRCQVWPCPSCSIRLGCGSCFSSFFFLSLCLSLSILHFHFHLLVRICPFVLLSSFVNSCSTPQCA